jgi:hypothetical protein
MSLMMAVYVETCSSAEDYECVRESHRVINKKSVSSISMISAISAHAV